MKLYVETLHNVRQYIFHVILPNCSVNSQCIYYRYRYVNYSVQTQTNFVISVFLILVILSGTPYAFKQAGLPLGVILLFAIAGITGKRHKIQIKKVQVIVQTLSEEPIPVITVFVYS